MANSKEIVIKIEDETDPSAAFGGQIIECDSGGKWTELGPLAKSIKRNSTWVAVIDANGKFTIPDISISTYYHIKQPGTLPSIVKSEDLIKTGEFILKKDPNSTLAEVEVTGSIPVKPVQPGKPASKEDGTRFEYEINNLKGSKVSVSLYAIIQRNGKIIDDRIIATSSPKRYKKDSTDSNSIEVIATELKRQVIFDSENLISYRYDTLISEDEVTLRTFENRLPSQISKAEANYIIPKTKKEITGNEVVNSQNNDKNGAYDKKAGTSFVTDVSGYHKAGDILKQENEEDNVVFNKNYDIPNSKDTDSKQPDVYNKPTTYNNSVTNINNQSILNSENNNTNNNTNDETQSNSSNQITNSVSTTQSESSDFYLEKDKKLKEAKAIYTNALYPKTEIGGTVYAGTSKLTKDEKAEAHAALKVINTEIKKNNKLGKIRPTKDDNKSNPTEVVKKEASVTEASKEKNAEQSAGMAAAVEKATALQNKKSNTQEKKSSGANGSDGTLQQLGGLDKKDNEPDVKLNTSSLVENIQKITTAELVYEDREDITDTDDFKSDSNISAAREKSTLKNQPQSKTKVKKKIPNTKSVFEEKETPGQKIQREVLTSLKNNITNLNQNPVNTNTGSQITNTNNTNNNTPVELTANNPQSMPEPGTGAKETQEKPEPVDNSQSALNSQLLNAIYDLLSTGIKVKYS